MATKPALAISALRLRNLEPAFWEIFLRDVEAYQDALTQELTMAPTADILVAQGRVQSIRALLRVLKECHLEPKGKPLPQGGNPAP